QPPPISPLSPCTSLFRSGFALDLFRNAVCRKNGNGAVGNFRHFADEDDALAAQIGHHPLVMNDLMPYVDRRAVEGECALDEVARSEEHTAELQTRGHRGC